MIVTSYYTNRKYRDAAGDLARSLDRFGFVHEIDAVTDQGSFLANRRFKVSFILSKLVQHPTEDIVWMDADTVLRQDPLLFRDFPAHISMCRIGVDGWHSPVVMVKNVPESVDFLNAWVDEHSRQPEDSDMNIRRAVVRVTSTFRPLPHTYGWFEPVFRQIYPTGEPVVEHFCIGRLP